MKDISKIIRESENLSYKIYERNRSKHETTDSYFYLVRQIVVCMIRDNSLNSDNCTVRTEITGAKHIPILHVFSMDDIESKYFLV